MTWKSQPVPEPDRRMDRRMPGLRLALFAPILLTDLGTGRVLRTPTADLDQDYCFIKTPRPFPKGTRVRLEIAHRGELFAALGQVAYIAEGGMEVAFSMMDSENRQILSAWLHLPAERR